MVNSEHNPAQSSADPVTPVDPRAPGAVVVAFIAALVVCGIWFAFYMLVFLPRAVP
jgi:predicted secreted protein